MIIIISSVCFSADLTMMQNANGGGDTGYVLPSDKKTDNTPTPNSSFTGCTSYDDCLQNGLKEMAEGKNSVLLYYSDTNKDTKYNIFNDITLKLSSNICPPIINVYKKVNNVNFIMDVFSRRVSEECIVYYSNIAGDGRNRDTIVGQVEIYFCNKDILSENCNTSILYLRQNNFVYKTLK